MTEMIERVTLAIAQLRWAEEEAFIGTSIRKVLPMDQRTALVAIKAMREPTEEMVKAAHTKGDDPRYHPGGRNTLAEQYWPIMVRRWENMIDAALGKTDGT